jgi:hypothetical protein
MGTPGIGGRSPKAAVLGAIPKPPATSNTPSLTPEEEYKHPKFHHPKKCGKPLTVCYRYTGKKPNRNRLERLPCQFHRKNSE